MADRSRPEERTDETPIPRAATSTYLAALLLIAGISLASFLLTRHITDRVEKSASLVNVAGRQRMYAQRIAKVALQVADGSIDEAAGRAELLAMADRMEKAQTRLIESKDQREISPATSPQLQVIFFGSSRQLKQQVDAYLVHTRAFAARQRPGLDDPDLRSMLLEASASLPLGLEAVVSEYQNESEHDARRLRHVITTLTAVMLLVLVLEALLIYRPLFKHLNDALTELGRTSTTDPLTGVLNRRAFLQGAERDLARADRMGQGACLLVADIDQLKPINDAYGPATGDLVIQHFAAVAEANLRSGDSLGRVGGEEFAILMPGATLDGARLAAERIRERFGATTAAVAANSRRVLATVSIGLVITRGGKIGPILVEADELLRRAKEAGRNRVESGRAVPPDAAVS